MLILRRGVRGRPRAPRLGGARGCKPRPSEGAGDASRAAGAPGMTRLGMAARRLKLRGCTDAVELVDEVDEEWACEERPFMMGGGGGGWFGAGRGDGERWMRGPEGRWRLISLFDIVAVVVVDAVVGL